MADLLSAAALAFSVLVYVLLDGTDLGVGLLIAGQRRVEQREIMVRTLLPVWDANETWLVLGGGGLLALFPMAYSILLPALYLPFLLMFMALILRAVGLEFREHVVNKGLADAALLLGSLIATLCQGVILGTLMQGVPHNDGQYSGNGREWLAPFPMACAVALVVGYAWLGACWLYWRCEGDLQRRAKHHAQIFCALSILALGGVLALTLQLDERYWQRLTQPWLLIATGSLSVALLAGFARSWRAARHWQPLSCALGMIVMAFTLMLVALFPQVIPPSLTLAQAAAAPSTQLFVLSGLVLLVPITLAYNTWGFKVFSGKVGPPG
ncbi:cytochrome d ubiquinol oxidase subunit II [Pseudomonas tructae]|uniref:Cytochrome d ubiquinol oxidase subunit II n=1 Tax=Pseudomonas tructae TaxID=2518644 RepID=A0A411MJ00_9PSED|nr:cytochrome d ubiquinol oxidase subunit II [Pseudomonas tructae]QBF26767.1 cytochrome d ubiquinol oxidase subunit II [Pseudomonas tructae]